MGIIEGIFSGTFKGAKGILGLHGGITRGSTRAARDALARGGLSDVAQASAKMNAARPGYGASLAPVQRVIGGAAIGGIYGGATSDMNTAEGMAGDIAVGALGGAAVGLSTVGGVWRGLTGFSPTRVARNARQAILDDARGNAAGAAFKQITPGKMLDPSMMRQGKQGATRRAGLWKQAIGDELRRGPGGRLSSLFRMPRRGSTSVTTNSGEKLGIKSFSRNPRGAKFAGAASPAAISQTPGQNPGLIYRAASGGGRLGMSGARTGMRVGAGLVTAAPGLVGGTVAAGGLYYGLSGMSQQQPTRENAQSVRRLQSSAAGVVQGLHGSRHGGA